MRLIQYIENNFGKERGNKAKFCATHGLIFSDVSRMLAAGDWGVIEFEGEIRAFKLSKTKLIKSLQAK